MTIRQAKKKFPVGTIVTFSESYRAQLVNDRGAENAEKLANAARFKVLGYATELTCETPNCALIIFWHAGKEVWWDKVAHHPEETPWAAPATSFEPTVAESLINVYRAAERTVSNRVNRQVE